MKKNRKMLPGILAGVIAFLALTAYLLLEVILPVTYDIDESLIVKNGNYDVVTKEVGDFTALLKANAVSGEAGPYFHVMGFTDLHLDHKKEKSEVTMEYLIRNIVVEKPDLVVFVGDNITSALNRPRARQLARTMEKLGVYWTLVLGNHEGDNFFSMSRPTMLRLFARYPHCLVDASTKRTSDGTKVAGNGNHCILLLDADENITEALIFVDGGTKMSDKDMKKYGDEFEDKDHNEYDYVKESQIVWYQEAVASFEMLAGGPVKSVVFDHIPLPEFNDAWDSGEGRLFGDKRETICCSGHNSHFFDAIKECGSTQAVICGHDHINDFAVEYEGILLAYNVPSGYSSYNTYTKGLSDDLLQGCSVYVFSPDGSFSMPRYHNCDRWPDRQDAIRELYK